MQLVGVESAEMQIAALSRQIRPRLISAGARNCERINIKKLELKDKINAANVEGAILEKELAEAEDKVQSLNPQTRRLPPSIEALRDDVARAGSGPDGAGQEPSRCLESSRRRGASGQGMEPGGGARRPGL